MDHKADSGGSLEGIYRSSLDARKPQNTTRRESGGGLEGIYRSSLDTREPQNPTKSDEYQRHF
eukprot:2587412-Pyramimonas_sp.AAC.1